MPKAARPEGAWLQLALYAHDQSSTAHLFTAAGGWQPALPHAALIFTSTCHAALIQKIRKTCVHIASPQSLKAKPLHPDLEQAVSLLNRQLPGEQHRAGRPDHRALPQLEDVLVHIDPRRRQVHCTPDAVLHPASMPRTDLSDPLLQCVCPACNRAHDQQGSGTTTLYQLHVMQCPEWPGSPT